MVQLSGQYGVPVIAVDGHVIVGFDRARLEAILKLRPAGPTLGASVADAAIALAKRGRSPVEGVLVGKVREGSPAQRAGLRPGDIILAVEEEAVRTVGDLEQRLSHVRSGSRVRLKVLRDGNILSLEVSF